MWEQELIPDDAILFMRIHKNNFDRQSNMPIPGAFKNIGEGMSTDWNKYSSPMETLNRGKIPADNGVLSLNVKNIRQIPDQIVEHSPGQSNRSHTDVKGKKEVKQRALFLQIFKWEIIPPK